MQSYDLNLYYVQFGELLNSKLTNKLWAIPAIDMEHLYMKCEAIGKNWVIQDGPIKMNKDWKQYL